MSITRVQHAIATGLDTSPSANFGTATTAGNLLVIAIGTQQPASASLTGATLAASNASYPYSWIFFIPNAPSVSTLTASLTASVRWVMDVIEYSGIAVSGALDASGSIGNATGVSPLLATGSPSEVIVFAYAADSSPIWGAPTNSFGTVDTANNGVALSLAVFDRIVSSTGSYSTTASPSGNNFSISGASFTSTAVVPMLYQRPTIVRPPGNPLWNW